MTKTVLDVTTNVACAEATVSDDGEEGGGGLFNLMGQLQCGIRPHVPHESFSHATLNAPASRRVPSAQP